MEPKRPQLSADDLVRLQWLLGSVVAAVSAATILFMEVQAWLLLGAVFTAAIAAVVWPRWPSRVPRWAHALAFPVIAAAFAYDLYASREPLAALIRLDLLLVTYRLMTYRRRRDDLQLIVLGLFLIVVAGVLTVSLAFTVQILAFTACSLVFLFVITLTEVKLTAATTAAPSGAPGAPSWTRGSWSDLARRVRAALDWRVAALSAALFAGVVAVSALLFLAIPRFEIQNGLFLDQLINRKTQTGFSDSIRFGEVTDITKDNSLALMVDGIDPGAMPHVPYWRMVVLDQYTGGGFSMSPELRQTVTGGRTRAHAPGLRPRTGEAATWTMYLEPGISRYLPLLGDYRGVTFAEPQAFRINNVERVLALQRDPPKMLAYRVDGMMADAVMPDSARPSSANHDATAAAADRYLALPIGGADLQRLQEFVAPLRAASPAGAEAFARVASEWLGSRHTYSLQSALPPGAGDPLVRWLDSNAPGHCEFFAGGLVLLTRAAGFPSRLITGFKGGTWNAYSNSFAVRNANAHAWCEVYDAAKGGWVRIDPTPGAEAEAAGGGEAGAAGRTNRSIDEGWQARFESLRVFWYRQVVNFDQSSQVELAVAAKQAMENAGQRLKAWVETRAVKWQRWLAQPWGWTRALRVAGAAAIVVALFWFWRAFGRGWWLRWRSRHRRDVRHDPVRREAARWLRRLAHASGRADTAEVENALARLRYGHPKTWPNPATVFRAAKRTLRR